MARTLDFVCFRCGRHLQSEQTFKRHDRYCRKKTTTPHSRRKSCVSCVSAKTRCILEGDGCTRCKMRKTPCQLNTPSLSFDENLTDETFARFDGIEQRGSASPHATLGVDKAIQKTPTIHSAGTPQAILDPFDTFDTFPIDDLWGDLNLTSEQPIVQVDGYHTHVQSHQYFQPRNLHPCLRPTISMATGILRSYSELMRHPRTFPPFIRPRAHGTADNNWAPPIQLANAASIAHMFHERSAGSKSFIWKAIRSEQENILNDYLYLDKNALLAAIQALLVYALMRMVDTPEEADNFDHDLIESLYKTCTHMTSVVHGHLVTVEEIQGKRLSWKEWIFVESLRRTVAVMRILFQLVNIDIELPCPPLPSFAISPLPSNKLLWRAATEEAWESEWENEVKETSIHGMLNNGDLVKLKNGTTEAHQRKADWDKWYAGADELGLLVVLSARLRESDGDFFSGAVGGYLAES